ncbi:hypothetical protein CC85DRAFT_324409 [Cutaneotrichosporon oleaginosum]|uniref:Uncharacterized protein n=1 Tax=Cutaneotrichosporon oleaginosum TaxID=879819 RepID=A0A0J1AV73_9TREE|nr:uncharacterized protein CC85DRAFT_324409 [Cutaneotrichosporon oleaginosum]KLT39199.1 hypothetical protein CC85DRAFT_324409 [Cutaneotrichosporon oleaginosum]TXT04412.1 hypothetical protein COLE_07231 [Cutaneotrichosporon oleaginosum]
MSSVSFVELLVMSHPCSSPSIPRSAIFPPRPTRWTADLSRGRLIKVAFSFYTPLVSHSPRLSTHPTTPTPRQRPTSNSQHSTPNANANANAQRRRPTPTPTPNANTQRNTQHLTPYATLHTSPMNDFLRDWDGNIQGCAYFVVDSRAVECYRFYIVTDGWEGGCVATQLESFGFNWKKFVRENEDLLKYDVSLPNRTPRSLWIGPLVSAFPRFDKASPLYRRPKHARKRSPPYRSRRRVPRSRVPVQRYHNLDIHNPDHWAKCWSLKYGPYGHLHADETDESDESDADVSDDDADVSDETPNDRWDGALGEAVRIREPNARNHRETYGDNGRDEFDSDSESEAIETESECESDANADSDYEDDYAARGARGRGRGHGGGQGKRKRAASPPPHARSGDTTRRRAADRPKDVGPPVRPNKRRQSANRREARETAPAPAPAPAPQRRVRKRAGGPAPAPAPAAARAQSRAVIVYIRAPPGGVPTFTVPEFEAGKEYHFVYETVGSRTGTRTRAADADAGEDDDADFLETMIKQIGRRLERGPKVKLLFVGCEKWHAARSARAVRARKGRRAVEAYCRVLFRHAADMVELRGGAGRLPHGVEEIVDLLAFQSQDEYDENWAVCIPK